MPEVPSVDVALRAAAPPGPQVEDVSARQPEASGVPDAAADGPEGGERDAGPPPAAHAPAVPLGGEDVAGQSPPAQQDAGTAAPTAPSAD
jgi:hypothetical protein